MAVDNSFLSCRFAIYQKEHLGAISHLNHLSSEDWFDEQIFLSRHSAHLEANQYHPRFHGSLHVNRGGVPLRNRPLQNLRNQQLPPNGQVHQVQSGKRPAFFFVGKNLKFKLWTAAILICKTQWSYSEPPATGAAVLQMRGCRGQPSKPSSPHGEAGDQNAHRYNMVQQYNSKNVKTK